MEYLPADVQRIILWYATGGMVGHPADIARASEPPFLLREYGQSFLAILRDLGRLRQIRLATSRLDDIESVILWESLIAKNIFSERPTLSPSEPKARPTTAPFLPQLAYFYEAFQLQRVCKLWQAEIVQKTASMENHLQTLLFGHTRLLHRPFYTPIRLSTCVTLNRQFGAFRDWNDVSKHRNLLSTERADLGAQTRSHFSPKLLRALSAYKLGQWRLHIKFKRPATCFEIEGLEADYRTNALRARQRAVKTLSAGTSPLPCTEYSVGGQFFASRSMRKLYSMLDYQKSELPSDCKVVQATPGAHTYHHSECVYGSKAHRKKLSTPILFHIPTIQRHWKHHCANDAAQKRWTNQITASQLRKRRDGDANPRSSKRRKVDD